MDLLLWNLLSSAHMGILGNRSRRRKQDFYHEKRRSERTKCVAAAKLADTSQSTSSFTIVDISESGVGIISSHNLEVSNVLHFTRPAMEAEVVWAVGNRAGLRIIR